MQGSFLFSYFICLSFISCLEFGYWNLFIEIYICTLLVACWEWSNNRNKFKWFAVFIRTKYLCIAENCLHMDQCIAIFTDKRTICSFRSTWNHFKRILFEPVIDFHTINLIANSKSHMYNFHSLIRLKIRHQISLIVQYHSHWC